MQLTIKNPLNIVCNIHRLLSLRLQRKREIEMVVAFSASEGNVEDNLLPGTMSNGNVVCEEELGDDEEEEEENVTVEYSNLQSMRISVDEFLRSFPDRKANSVLEEEFKVNKYLSKAISGLLQEAGFI